MMGSDPATTNYPGKIPSRLDLPSDAADRTVMEQKCDVNANADVELSGNRAANSTEVVHEDETGTGMFRKMTESGKEVSAAGGQDGSRPLEG